MKLYQKKQFLRTLCSIFLYLNIIDVTNSRLLSGQFYTSFADLRDNPDSFFICFRMSVRSFDELENEISPKITSQNTNMILSIPPLEMLAVTLR